MVHRAEFLSIDCGADVGRTDGAGIKWLTDDGYVKTGMNVQLRTTEISTLSTARVFTEKRSKHFYVLPVQKNSTYLLRTIQYAGESTSTASIAFPVSFNVTVNNEVWYSFSGQTDRDRDTTFYESVFYSIQKEEVDACFVAGAGNSVREFHRDEEAEPALVLRSPARRILQVPRLRRPVQHGAAVE